MKTRVIAFIATLVFATAAWAQGAPNQPEQLAKQTAHQIRNDIQQNRQKYQQNPEALYDLVDKVVLPHFDFRYMSQIVMGRYWRQASPDQRNRFTQAFKSLLVRTYANSLLEYSNNKIVWKPVHAAPNATHVTVRSEVEVESGPAVPIDYSMRKEQSGWKVYDVAVDGVSLVTNYRSSFSATIQEKGIDGLIKQIQRKANAKATRNKKKHGS